MSYFLRFTQTPDADLERNTSNHYSDLDVNSFTKEEAAESFGCDEDSVIEYEGYWVQELNGLCGFDITDDISELMDDGYDLIEAIEEMISCGEFDKSSVYNTEDMPFAVYEGELSNDFDLVPDGDLFLAEKIAYKS